MLHHNHHTRGLRALALLVAVVQLTAVTWVPIVHPLIHPDQTLSTPVSALDVQTSGEEAPVLGEAMCVACMVSPNALPSPYRLLPGAEIARKQQLTRQAVERHPLQSFIPTHPARAPPSL